MDLSTGGAPGPIPILLYLVAGASFVEITSDLYAGNLAEYFIGTAASPSGSGNAGSPRRNSTAWH